MRAIVVQQALPQSHSRRAARWQRTNEGLVHGTGTGVMNAVQKAQATGSNPLDPFAYTRM